MVYEWCVETQNPDLTSRLMTGLGLTTDLDRHRRVDDHGNCLSHCIHDNIPLRSLLADLLPSAASSPVNSPGGALHFALFKPRDCLAFEVPGTLADTHGRPYLWCNFQPHQSTPHGRLPLSTTGTHGDRSQFLQQDQQQVLCPPFSVPFQHFRPRSTKRRMVACELFHRDFNILPGAHFKYYP